MRRAWQFRLAPAVLALTVVAVTGDTAPTQSSPAIDVICLSTYKRANYGAIIDGILGLDYVDGLLLYIAWRDFEPRPGEYRWKIIDTALDAAESRRKRVSFGLLVQAQAPAWLLERCRTFRFQHPHPSVGSVVSPVPWDETYRAALFSTVRALGNRYDGHPALRSVVINGPSSLFGVETNFPLKEIAPEEAAKLTFTHTKFSIGWKTSVELFAGAFPHTLLSLGLHHDIALGEGGSEAVMRTVLDIRDFAVECERRHGKPLILRLLGLSTPHPRYIPGPSSPAGEATTDYLRLLREVPSRVFIALEAARVFRNSNVAGRQHPLSPLRFRRVLELGAALHASRLQIKDPDVWDVRAMKPYEPYARTLAAFHARTGSAPAKPRLFAVYYTWYATAARHGRWSGWDHPGSSKARPHVCDPGRMIGDPPRRDICSNAYPLIDVYDSDDPAVVRWHIRLAKAAGIEAFLVDWWGPATWQRIPGFTHDAFADVVLPMAEQEKFKVCLFDETAQFVKDFEEVKRWAAEALGRFKDSPAYLRIDGEPVYVIYQVPFAPRLTPAQATELHDYVESRVGPVYWVLDKIANAPDPSSGGFQAFVVPDEWLALEWVDAFCGYGTFAVQRKYEYAEIAPRFAAMSDLAHQRGHRIMLPVHPGHDNSKLQMKPWVMPRRNGRTLREYLLAAEDAGADFICVTSFNEWPETTQIEPSLTWQDPHQYLRLLAQWKGIDYEPPPMPEASGARGGR